MPDVSYSYRIRVGPHTWTGDGGDAADYGPVDGLTLIRKVMDTNLWPPPEDTAECRFQVVAAAASDLPGIVQGAPVVVEYDSPAVGSIISPLEKFYGRVGEPVCTPHGLGVVFNLNCLDYTADLRDKDVGGTDYPAESIQARIVRIMGEAGYSVTFATVASQPPEPSPLLAARTASATNAWELVNSYLEQWPAFYEAPVGVFRGPWRMELRPTFDVNDELSAWRVQPVMTAPPLYGPLHLENVGGLWTAVADEGTSNAFVIPAGEVDFGSSYAMTKQDGVTRVAISGDKFTTGPATVAADLGVTPTVLASIDSVELTDTADAADLAQLYLPADVPVTRWLADSFLWHTEYAGAGAVLPALRDVVTVGGIDPRYNPTGNSWYTGQLASYEWTLANKRPTYQFTLRRPDFSAADSLDVLRWNSPALVGKTWATLNPADSWDDYRLVRGTNT